MQRDANRKFEQEETKAKKILNRRERSVTDLVPSSGAVTLIAGFGACAGA
jgi:hypothetical protein